MLCRGYFVLYSYIATECGLAGMPGTFAVHCAVHTAPQSIKRRDRVSELRGIFANKKSKRPLLPPMAKICRHWIPFLSSLPYPTLQHSLHSRRLGRIFSLLHKFLGLFSLSFLQQKERDSVRLPLSLLQKFLFFCNSEKKKEEAIFRKPLSPTFLSSCSLVLCLGN